jgi:thymidylate synthase (FAD)
MRLIKPSFEIIEQQHGLEGIYKIIEQAGRTCYKSCDKITEDSAKEFVNRIIGNKHHTVLEHGTVYLDFVDNIAEAGRRYTNNHYSRVYKNAIEDDRGYCHLYITTNFRVLVENKWLDDLQYICEPTRYHEKRYTVRFICDRGVSHEFVRHRVFSFAQESTRRIAMAA